MTTITPESQENMHLQLGDIIQIIAPTNSDINDKIYLIKYLDNTELILIDINTLEQNNILIGESGNLNDESITGINILNRAEFPGYAKQNGLLPDTWIDIYFDGETPTIITGRISNLEEDMIEINTYPENDNIYIDFGFKGIPKDLPIEKILIRPPPEAFKSASLESKVGDTVLSQPEATIPLSNEEDYLDEEQEDELSISPINVREQIKELILTADQIQFGDTLEEITQTIDVPEEEQRYGIDKQTTDMLDEFLSTVPNAERTEKVLNDIHIMIERFKQLRNEYSDFDENGNAQLPKIKGATYRPLIKSLEQLNKKLYWILPIVQNKKKVYDLEFDEMEVNNDIVNETLANTRIIESDIVEQYKTNDIPENDNKYEYLYKELNPLLTPYTNPSPDDNNLIAKKVNTNLTSIVDNLDDLYSSVVNESNLKKRKFVIQTYNLGLSQRKSSDLKNKNSSSEIIPLTQK